MESAITDFTSSLQNHLIIAASRQEVEVTEAKVKDVRSQFYPQLQGQYGWQQVAGVSGFYTYQLGIKIPLVFSPELGQAQSATIKAEQAKQKLIKAQIELKADYLVAKELYLKWYSSWRYYKENVLPLAKKQQEGAKIAYSQGAMSYTVFLQTFRDAVELELAAWNAFDQLLQSQYQLMYYLKK